MNISSNTQQRVGIFTGGGIAPGLNAVLSTATRTLKRQGHEAIGIPEGWKGMLKRRNDIINLTKMTERQLHDLMSKGGTLLRSSRTKIKQSQYDQVRDAAEQYGLTGIIAIGGDDTLGQARELHEQGIIRANGVPKTIDNDVFGTDRTFGFETAYDRVANVVRDMRTDATSMSRVAVVEAMGRNAGWITLYGGEAGGADITLIPEFPINEKKLMERIEEVFAEKSENGNAANAVVIAISEGYFGEDQSEIDEFNHGRMRGAAARLACMIKAQTKLSTQEQVIGYHARNGAPVAHDAVFASQLGALAGMLSANNTYGRMTALREGKITDVDLSEVAGGRIVTKDLYDPETMRMRLEPQSIQNVIKNTRNKSNMIPQIQPDQDTDEEHF